jgi:hypothetical protein
MEELLVTIAQLALALAGFTSMVTAFMKRPGKLTHIEVYRISVLLGGAFSAMFLALVPLLFVQFGLDGETLWRTSSGVMALSGAISLPVMMRASMRIRRDAPEIFNSWVFGSIVTGHAINVVLQVCNATWLDAAVAPGIYAVGLLWYLLHAAVQFSRILFIQPADPA